MMYVIVISFLKFVSVRRFNAMLVSFLIDSDPTLQLLLQFFTYHIPIVLRELFSCCKLVIKPPPIFHTLDSQIPRFPVQS